MGKKSDSMIEEQLNKMNISFDTFTEIRSKDGRSVYRVKSGEKSYVLKYFERDEDRREIGNYLILQKLGIPTIPLICHTDEAILIYDIDASDKYRLASEADMIDTEVCSALANWYRNLHEKGKEYVREHGGEMYAETDCITAENIAFIKTKTHTENNTVWTVIEQNMPRLQNMIADTAKTLNYNDFYYTNMVVAKDKSEAFMFTR